MNRFSAFALVGKFIGNLLVIVCLTSSAVLADTVTASVDTDWHALVAKWEIPDTPDSIAVAATLEMLSRDDPDFAREYVMAMMHPDLQKDMGIESLTESMIQYQQKIGEFEIVEGGPIGPAEIELIIQELATSNRFVISVLMDAEADFSIIGLMVEPRVALPDFESLEAIASYLDEQAAADAFSGAVMIARGSEILLRRAYGDANRELGTRNQPETRFNLGSLNKFITQIALMQLVERGLINLDATIGTYIDSVESELLDQITVYQLLTMRSGMGGYFRFPEYEQNPISFDGVDDYLPAIFNAGLDFEPGTDQRYSNSGYVVLGAVIEGVSGMSYDEYVAANIFEPAGMGDTGAFEYRRAEELGLARGYSLQMGGDEPQDTTEIWSRRGTPAGGGFSTIDDLLKLDRAFGEGALISLESAERMLNMMGGQDLKEITGKLAGRIGMAGGAPGVSTVFHIDFDSGVSVIILANMDEPIAERMGDRFFALAVNLE